MRWPPPRRRNDEERILPLINVVFLLLIFFMVAGHLAATDPFDIAPPRSSSQGQSSPEAMTVQLGADGQLALDGEPIEEGALRTAVAERRAGDEAAPVRLKADGRAEATSVVAVMERLREAGVEHLELLTVPAER